MFNLREMPNGKLRIFLPEEYAEELLENFRKYGNDIAFQSGFADYPDCQWSATTGDCLGQLTNAPVVVRGLIWTYDEDDTLNQVFWDKMWWFSDYAIKSEIEELLLHGYVDFEAV